MPAATKRGVIVVNSPEGNTIAAAEHALALMLSLSRHVPHAHASTMAGGWDRKKYVGNELYKKKLGVVGLGKIGSHVARVAKAMGMDVMAYDPFVSAERAQQMQVRLMQLPALFAEADYVSLHLPRTPDTENLVNAELLRTMKPTARIVNCARGGIIKESALIAGLKSGHVAAAGLDVFETEPLAKDSELRSLPNVILTPHIAASTTEAQETVGIEVAEQIADVLNGGVIRNAVNMPTMDANAVKVLGPYIDLGTKLGTLVQQIAPAQIATLRITYWGKIVDLDVNAVTRAIERGFLRRISGDAINFVNAPSALERLGVRAEVVKSTDDSGYTDLMSVEAVAADGSTHSALGTLIGKGNQPRIVGINGREVEVAAEGKLLVLENIDQPGMVGTVGTILGKAKVNIADMSLSRLAPGGTAYMVVRVDQEPGEAARAEIKGHAAIKLAKFVQL